MKKVIVFICLLGSLFSSHCLVAQGDTIYAGPRNVLKFNISSRILFGSDNYIIGYERRLKNPYHTISIDVGYRSLPKLINIGKQDSAFLIRDHDNKGGVSVSLDYRFYLKKHNVGLAPKGVFIAPFVDFFSNDFTNNISVFGNTDQIESKFKIDSGIRLYSVGFKLGYQFLFWDRLPLDLALLGPSFTRYTATFKISGDVAIDQENEYLQELKERILDKYPLIEDVFDEKVITKSGNFATSSIGFHYSIRIGYAFGGKK